MSIDSAIGRIDQIYALEQQLRDPASLRGAGASTSTAGSPAAGAGTSTDFATALAAAQGVTGAGQVTPAGPAAGAVGPAGVAPTGPIASDGGVSPVPPQVQAMVQQADSLVGKPYVFGGGHAGWGLQAGYDCSGFVSAVLHAGGFLSSPADTTSLPGQAGMAAGPGRYVTVYDRAQPGDSGHVIIEINGQFYESGGSHGAWGGGGGVQKIGTPSASYLATFETVLHPQGL